jgi:hypothetical protein
MGGNLVGKIFSLDTIVSKEISFPFNMADDYTVGTIIRKPDMGVFLMVDIYFSKQKLISVVFMLLFDQEHFF